MSLEANRILPVKYETGERQEMICMKELIFLAAIWLVFIPEPLRAQEALNLEDENARINYSVGYQVGGDFRRQGLELDPEVVAKGIEDAPSGNKPLITTAEMRKELTELQRRVSAKQAAPAAQAAEVQRQAGLAFLEANKAKAGVRVTASGLQYKIIREGTGKIPSAQDSVRVHYRGTRVDGSEFDSSYKRGAPAEFRLDRVIKGWGEGLQLMKEGAKYELYIPPELAYGDQGRLANQTLIFEVDLISVENEE
jgi:FKBP-type peptidyl-prolyl cis-trans isomerase FklB